MENHQLNTNQVENENENSINPIVHGLTKR